MSLAIDPECLSNCFKGGQAHRDAGVFPGTLRAVGRALTGKCIIMYSCSARRDSLEMKLKLINLKRNQFCKT